MAFRIGLLIPNEQNQRAGAIARIIQASIPGVVVSTLNLHVLVPDYWVAKANTKAKREIGPRGRAQFQAAMERLAGRYDAFVTYDLAFANHVLPERDAKTLNSTDVLGGMIIEAFGKPVLFVKDPFMIYGRPYSDEDRAVAGFMAAFYCNKLKNHMHGITDFTKPTKFVIAQSMADLQMLEKLASKSVMTSFDIETSGGYISVVGFALCVPGLAYTPIFVIPLLINLEGETSDYWDSDVGFEMACATIGNILANPVPKCAHNGSFDISHLFRYGWTINNYILDTMHFFHSIFPTMPKALYSVSSMFVQKYKYWKDDGKEVDDQGKTKWEAPRTADRTYGYWLYNALDCANTLDAALGLLDFAWGTGAGTRYPEFAAGFEHVGKTYIREFALQFGPALYMSMHGLPVTHERQDAMRTKLLNEARVKLAELHELIGDDDFNPNSPEQSCELIYDVLRAPTLPRKGRTADKRVLQAVGDAHPIFRDVIKHITDAKEPANNATKYGNLPLWYQIWLYKIKMGNTTTARAASSKHDFGIGCVRPTAEALTPRGWVPLHAVCDGDLIAQWDAGYITFVPCTVHWQDFAGQLRRYKSSQIDLTVTPGHRVLWENLRRNQTRVDHADNVRGTSIYIPNSGKFEGQRQMPAYAPMLFADFSYDQRGWYGGFKKERKKQRVRELCAKFGLEYTETEMQRRGYTRFTIKNVPADMPYNWGPWVLECANLPQLVQEAAHWDSHARGKSFVFSTASEFVAHWMQTAAHLSGMSATVRTVEQPVFSFSDTTMYSVNVKPRNAARVERHHWESVDYIGKVGCPTVPSSFWLVRENGQISVTGNTNMQNVPKSMRMLAAAYAGTTLVSSDYSQSDSYFVAFESQDEAMIETVTDDRDTHSVHVEFFFGHKYEDVVAGADKKEPWVVHPETGVRQIIKKVSHGTNYDMGGGTMLLNVRKEAAWAMVRALLSGPNSTKFMSYMSLDKTKPAQYYIDNERLWANPQLEKACDFAQALYYMRYPTLKRWKQAAVQGARMQHGVITMYGGSSTVMLCDPARNPRFIPASYGQGGTAGNINNAMLRLYYLADGMWKNGFKMIIQVHDELVCSIPDGAYDLVERKVKIMEHPCTIHGRTFTIPVEAELTKSWQAKWTVKFKGLGAEKETGYTKALEDNENKVLQSLGLTT